MSKYFGRNIRGGEYIGDILILDEVDNMMIDNAAKTLYISHQIVDMRHLKDIFIQMWACVNTLKEAYYSPENVRTIKNYMNQNMAAVEQVSIDVFVLKKRFDSVVDKKIVFCDKESELRGVFLEGEDIDIDGDESACRVKHGAACMLTDLVDTARHSRGQ